MKQYYEVDGEGYFSHDILAEYSDENPMPDNVTDVKPPDYYRPKWTGTAWIETGTPPQPDIEALRSAKLAEISALCEQTIHNGVDVETSDGTHHFNASDNDQRNLGGYRTEIIALEAGLESEIDPEKSIWYKADGEDEHHRFWSIADMGLIIKKVFGLVVEQLTYCDMLKMYVRSLDNANDIEAAYYGMTLDGGDSV